MFQLRDKTIYIISPERWGTMKVSKHHYALELANQQCRVFFIEPPNNDITGIEITECPDHPLIRIVRYKPVFRGKRFLPKFIFSWMLIRQVKALIQKIAVKPDIVWSFQGYLFENLGWFGAPVKIFFAADQFLYDVLPPEVDSATFSLAISDTIYERIKKSNKPVFKINHGLQKEFVQQAEILLQQIQSSKPASTIVAGYTGNLRMEAIDRTTMMAVIEQHPEIKFLFWGSYKKSEMNLGGLNNLQTDEFIQFLQKQPNVELRGVLDSEQLQQQMKEANLFWICWKIGVNALWDGSNSHKLLEYLSFGKPVVAHHVSSYQDSRLLQMLSTKQNTGYTKLFKEVAAEVEAGEDIAVIKKRISFAISNSYLNHLQEIESLINS